MINWLKQRFSNKTNETTAKKQPYAITLLNLFKFSEHIEHFHAPEKLSDDDIIHLSHKKENGNYETTFIRLKQLKEFLKSND